MIIDKEVLKKAIGTIGSSRRKYTWVISKGTDEVCKSDYEGCWKYLGFEVTKGENVFDVSQQGITMNVFTRRHGYKVLQSICKTMGMSIIVYKGETKWYV